MKIHSLRLTSFGKFKNKTIALSDGINLIYGKNEAGKSTVMAFIKAMLYGFNGRGADGDRKRYIPWDGGGVSGEMEVTLSGGRRVVIIRSAGRTPAQDTFRVLDAVTGEECIVDLAEEIGVGENAFLKTLFIRQMDASISGGEEELTSKLINLAGSGDADTGFEKSMSWLRDKIRYLKHQRGDGGRINELKKEITALAAEIEAAEEENKRYTAYIAEEKKLRIEIESLQKKLRLLSVQREEASAAENVKKADAAEKRLRAMMEGKESAEALLESLIRKAEELSVFNASISDSIFVSEDSSPLELRLNKTKKKVNFLFVAAGVSFLLGIFLLFLKVFPGAVACMMIAALILTLGITGKREKKGLLDKLSALKKKETERAALLASYGCASVKEYNDKLVEKRNVTERIQEIEEKINFLSAEVETAVKECEIYKKTVESYKGSTTVCTFNTEELNQEIYNTEQSLALKIREAATVEGILKGGVGNKKTADVLLSEQACLMEQLEEAETELSALQLAAETLEEVYTDLSRDFTPRINEKASEIFSALVGRADEKLLLDKKYVVTVERGEHHLLKFFSGGTIDQAFLAVRLAIAELVLKDKEMPVFLDDSFQQYDEEREENAIAVLRKFSEKRQIIWFSCKDRVDREINRIEI